jgi:hypothetical protein
MSSTPRVNRFLFVLFFLLSLCVGGSALMWPSVRSAAYAPLRDSLFPNFYLTPQAGKSVTLIIAVPPALEDWVRDSMTDFSKQNPLISAQVVSLRGADANRRLNVMTGLPDVWIAESDWTRIAAGGIPFEATGTVIAQDSFLWAASVGASAEVSDNLNWMGLARAADVDPQFRLAVPPESSIEGMGACLSAAAEYFQQSSLSAAQINDPAFQHWLAQLMEAVPDLSRNPLDQMASRPPQADAAFLTISDGRRLDPSAFFFQEPRYQTVLNFSLYVRSNWREKQDWEADLQRDAAQKIRSYLLSSDPQKSLSAYYVEKADVVFENPTRPADENAVYALQFCWRYQGGNS